MWYSTYVGGPPAALAIAGDFNSVPHLQLAFLPEEQRRQLPSSSLPDERSAVYGLLEAGETPADHPEHPDSFGKAAAAMAHAAKKPKRPDGIGPLNTRLGPLRDAYADGLAPGPLPLSTHSDDFAGTLDYIWLGGPGTGRLHVRQLLGMPYEVARPEEFGRIPDAQFPSDHLAIGVVLQLAALDS